MGRKQFWGWVLLFLLLSGGPVLLTALYAPEGWRIFGGLANTDDVSVYLAAMYQGMRGLWLYHTPFDPTPANPLLMYTLYLVMGKIAALFRADLTLIYHLGRLACGILTLVVAEKWTRALFDDRKHRVMAWMLVAFSSGLGPPETSTFLSVFASPHFALGIATEALALFAFWRATLHQRWLPWAVGGGVALLGLGLTYPFTLPVAYGVMGLYVLWTFWRNGSHRGLKTLRVALVAGGLPLPLLVYYAQIFVFDPFWQGTHVAQNVITTPGPLALIIRYGLLLPLGMWGLATIWQKRDEKSPWALIGLWGILNGLMLYLPVTFQWRLANGWHFALALLAALGLERGLIPWIRTRGLNHALRRASSQPTDTVRRILFMLTIYGTLIVPIAITQFALEIRDFQFYVPRDTLDAMDELAPHVDFDDVVLGSYFTGNVLPSHALCRVVVGQQFATLNPEEKREDVARFFDAATSEQERRAILAKYGVTVVYHGRWERGLGGFDPATAPYLRALSQTGETIAYRVVTE